MRLPKHTRSPRALVRALSIAALPALVVALPAGDAEACGGIRQEVEPTKVLLVQAERHLEDGWYARAAQKAARTVEQHATWSETWWRSRILATAAVRSHGRVSPHAWDHVLGNGASPKRNVSAAVAMLERMRLREDLRDDPTLLAALGEGLAQLPDREDEALRVLSDLAERDVLPSPSAWAALARLRAERGLTREAQLAQRTCEAMIGDGRKSVCQGAPSSGDGVL